MFYIIAAFAIPKGEIIGMLKGFCQIKNFWFGKIILNFCYCVIVFRYVKSKIYGSELSVSYVFYILFIFLP